MKIQSLFSLEIFRGGIFLELLKKIYKLFFFRIKISYFFVKKRSTWEVFARAELSYKIIQYSLNLRG